MTEKKLLEEIFIRIPKISTNFLFKKKRKKKKHWSKHQTFEHQTM